MSRKIIGIDLGTTKSSVGIFEKGRANVIPDQYGYKSIPSLVTITPDNKIYAGREAQKYPARYDGKNFTISSIKRSIGKKGETSWGTFNTHPQEVFAFILSELKLQAEDYLGEVVRDAVISIPSNYNDSQRRATIEAARIAGLNVVRLLNEASAACIAYGINRRKEEKVLIFDFGGGTLDVIVAEIGDGVYEVKSEEGDDRLGGDDFTQVIIDYIKEKLDESQRQYIKNNNLHQLFLSEAAEAAKIELSQLPDSTISVPGFFQENKGTYALYQKITRKKFENLSRPLVKRASLAVTKALKSAKLQINQLDTVIMIGGTSRMPIIRDTICSQLNILPSQLNIPDLGVVQGSCLYAGVLSGEIKDVLLMEIASQSYGIGITNSKLSILLEKNTLLPSNKSEIFTTSKDNQSEIKINIYQGEDTDVRAAHYIGSLSLNHLPPMPAGEPQIKVTFDIDYNHILHASIKDIRTGKEKAKQVIPPFALNEVQLQAMNRRMDKRQCLQQLETVSKQVKEILASSSNFVNVSEKNELNNMLFHLEGLVKKQKKTEKIYTFALLQIAEKIKNCKKKIAETKMSQSLIRKQNEHLIQSIENFLSPQNSLISQVEPEDAKYLLDGRKLVEDCIERKLPQDQLNRQLQLIITEFEKVKNALLEKLCNRQDAQELRKELIRVIPGIIKDPNLFFPTVDRILRGNLSIKLIEDFRDLIKKTDIQKSNLRSLAMKDKQIASTLLILTTFLNNDKSVLALLRFFDEERHNENNLILFSLFYTIARSSSSNCRSVATKLLMSKNKSDLQLWFFQFRYGELSAGLENNFLLQEWSIPVEHFWSYYQQAPSSTKKQIQQDKVLLLRTFNNLVVMDKASAACLKNPGEIFFLYLFLNLHVSRSDFKFNEAECKFLNALTINDELPCLAANLLQWMLTNCELSSASNYISPFWAFYQHSDKTVKRLIEKDSDLWFAIFKLCFESKSCDTDSASAAILATLKKYTKSSNLDPEIWELINKLKIKEDCYTLLLEQYCHSQKEGKKPDIIIPFLCRFSEIDILLPTITKMKTPPCYSGLKELMVEKCRRIPDGGEKLLITITSSIQKKKLGFLANLFLNKMARRYPELIGINKTLNELVSERFNE